MRQKEWHIQSDKKYLNLVYANCGLLRMRQLVILRISDLKTVRKEITWDV